MKKVFAVILGMLVALSLSRGVSAVEHGGKEPGGQEHGGTTQAKHPAMTISAMR